MKTSAAQIKAIKNNTNKALEDVRVLIGQYDTDVYDALQIIKAHYDGNRAKAIKQAILAHAKQIQQG